MSLTVGSIVHYVSHGTPILADGTQAYQSRCRAAIVTVVASPNCVGLAVLNPTGMFFHEAVGRVGRENLEPNHLLGGTWHEVHEVEA